MRKALAGHGDQAKIYIQTRHAPAIMCLEGGRKGKREGAERKDVRGRGERKRGERREER